jgi:lipopolysaccharide transport system ATP-binding protein
MTDIAISVRNVSKSYKVFENQRSRFLHTINPKYKTNVKKIWALQDINFEIKRGESVAIIGRNGGGKSTLLEILTGTLTPTTGEVIVNGRVSALLELGSGFNPEYTGRENVILNGLLLGLSRQDIMSRFAEIEAFAEIGTAIDRQVKTYSSGMMMRLAFAVQVLCDPDILIIDEALSVGDFFFQQKCLGYILGLCAKGTTLLFVSHDMGAVRDICKKGLLLNAGHMDFFGDKIDAIQQYLSNNAVGRPIGVVSPLERRTLEKNSFELKEPLWKRDEKDCSEKAHLVAINILDHKNQPCTSAPIGSEITIQALFTSPFVEPVHVSVVFKNRYDQIITSMGSYTLRTEMPSPLSGSTILFQLKIILAIEAGNYTFAVKLAHPKEIGEAAELLDETPWLGPIQVVWNYQNDIPPFYGMVGLPATAQFVTETDVI